MSEEKATSTRLMKVLLWAGIEDYCPLWQALWEVNTALPDASEQERLDSTRQLIQLLVDRGAIRLFWYTPLDGERAPDEVEMAEAQRLVNQPESWIVRPWESQMLGYLTTDKGEALYASLFEADS